MSIDFNMSSTDEEIQIPEEDILDVDLLISSVEERPLLWDKTLDSYSDRNEKRKCWRDIFSIMKPGFEELDIKDRKIIGNSIEKKWKHIKDAYFRSIKENKPKSGDGANKKRKKNYVYHDQLGFLIKTIQPRQTTSSLNIQPQTANESQIHDSSVELPVQHEELRPNKTTKKTKNVEDKFIEYLEEATKKNSQSHIQEKDEHEKFFDSLLSIVRQFNDDQSLMFRAEVIKVVQKIKDGPTHSSVQHQQSRPLQHFYESPYNYYNYNLSSNAPSSFSSSSSSPQVVYQSNIIADDQTFAHSPNMS